jgi:hypothetical protein
MNLADYLEATRRRLGWRHLAWGSAALAVAALAATGLLAWLVLRQVPGPGTLVGLRVLLVAGLLAGLALLLLRRPDAGAAVRLLEARVPDFGGRLGTWRDARRRGEHNPLLGLLARQVGEVAAAHPPHRVLPRRSLAGPGAVAGLGVLGLALLLAGTGPWQRAAQRLWVGELIGGAAPRILVSPGDTVVRRGTDLTLTARAVGFLPADMVLHADFGGGRRQQAPMSALGEGEYGFVLVGLTDDVDYYVAARDLSSARHRVVVADLPRVTGVELAYRFPEWTGLGREAQADGDVTALPGTEVAVAAQTDAPLAEAFLVVNGEPVDMRVDGSSAAAGFRVTEAGSWHVAVRHQGELARISERYRIELAEDRAPEVAYVWPGQDRQATAIEEVVLGFEAGDDYGVEALTLRYAVNGGAWQEVPLQAEEAGAREHLLALETVTAAEPEGARRLQAGDVISFYAEARDHTRATRTALYFVDVRPFEMRYRESQQMGGGAAGQGGGMDVARRQRELLTATWNLINRREELTPRQLADETETLAMLQERLKEQVETLIQRASARGLSREEGVSDFISELRMASGQMGPAAARLAEQALEEAIAPEQQALKHLVTAESSMGEMNVSMARSDGRGSSGRSLSELIELELDPERNRYEVPQRASFQDPGADGGKADWQRLEELAARQEQLARRQATGAESLASRWEQARLRRELEEMRRELESGGRDGGGGAADATGAAGRERSLAELDSARRALDRAAAGDPSAAREASDSLRQAARQLRQTAQDDLEERLARSGRRLSNLRADQERVVEALNELQQESLEAARRGEYPGLNDFRMQTFAEVKRRMQEELAELERELADLSSAADDRDPDGAALLEQALRELDEVRVDERLSAAAEAFEMGQPLYVIGNERVVARSLEQLSRQLQEAAQSLARAGRSSAGDPLSEVRELRRRLEAARTGGDLDEAEARAVARAAEALVREQPGGAGWSGDLARSLYVVRGTDPDNDDTLYRLTLEQLDLVENALQRADAPPVRAQEPRDGARDSSAAARYFRELSRGSD